MKKILLTSLVLIAMLSFSQIQSDCTVPSILQTTYDTDVKDLAYKYLVETNSPDTALIDIPQSTQNEIMGKLAAIFNAQGLDFRDDVFDIYCIHKDGYNLSFSNYIDVYIDTNYTWTDQWTVNHQTTTGYAELDSFMTNYNFSFQYAYPNYIKFANDMYINYKAFTDSLISYDGIVFAENETGNGDGNNITITNSGPEQIYTFILGYSDCLSGCIAHDYFNYSISQNCEVSFTGLTVQNPLGDSPFEINCNITPNFNPIQNLNWTHSYETPNNCFHLSWNSPVPTFGDTLVGYNIYRDNELYEFTTDTTHGCNPCIGAPPTSFCDFIDFTRGSFHIYVTAVYNYNHIESAITDSAFCEGILIERKEIINENTLNIYPNPTEGKFTIDASDIEFVEIVNINGETILTTNKNNIDLSNKAKGVYFVKVTTINSSKTSKIILK